MNKKLEIKRRRKVIKFSAAFFAISLLFVACKKEKTNIGEDLQNTSLNFVTADTFSLVTYSEEIDSMESDETSIGLLGTYNDPVFGTVDCGIVTQIVPEAFDPDFAPSESIVVDSVVLALRYSSINYYGNLEPVTLEVYEITDGLIRTDQVYHTFDSPTVTGSNLIKPGFETVDPDVVAEPIVGTDTLSPQLRIQLDPQVGTDLILDAEAGLLNSDFPNSTFKGLYLKANMPGLNPGQGTVLYFVLEDLLSKMTIYYKVDGGATQTFDFDINSTCARYNKITYDRTGTQVELALDDKSLGDDLFYMQGGSIRSVIELPYILDFYKDTTGNLQPKIINKAELILPVQDYQTDPFDPATKLFIARKVDNKISTFTADYGFGGTVAGNTVAYDEDAKEFRFAMTREVQGLLNGEFENVGYRIYSPAFFASTVERIIFNGPKSELKLKPRLEITYTEY